MKVTTLQVNRKIDVELSGHLATATLAQQKDCYRNAFRAMSMVTVPTTYVEGLAMIPHLGVPLDHGWLETEDGTVLDPTWYDRAPVVYVATYRYEVDELLNELSKNELTLPLSESPYIADRLSIDEYVAALRLCAEG